MDRHELRTWRKALGWTQEQAGEQLGVSRETVVRWEAGSPMWSETLIELACRTLTRDSQFNLPIAEQNNLDTAKNSLG